MDRLSTLPAKEGSTLAKFSVPYDLFSCHFVASLTHLLPGLCGQKNPASLILSLLMGVLGKSSAVKTLVSRG